MTTAEATEAHVALDLQTIDERILALADKLKELTYGTGLRYALPLSNAAKQLRPDLSSRERDLAIMTLKRRLGVVEIVIKKWVKLNLEHIDQIEDCVKQLSGLIKSIS